MFILPAKFSYQNEIKINFRQTKSVLELALDILEINFNLYILIQIIFNQALFTTAELNLNKMKLQKQLFLFYNYFFNRLIFPKAIYWKQEIFFEIMVKYSQTSSNDHLYKTTTRLRWPILSPPMPTLMQSLLYKTTTCLTRPANTLFVPEMEKNLSKTTTVKLYPPKKWEAMHNK